MAASHEDIDRTRRPAPLAGPCPERGRAAQRHSHPVQSAYFGFALAPDTNVSAASDADTVWLPAFGTLLPFRVNDDSRPSSGVGLLVWGGGEYQQPIPDLWGRPLRLRVGGDLWRQEYAHARVDHQRNARPWVQVSANYALPWGFTVGASANFYRTTYEASPYWRVLTRGDARRVDRGQSFRLTLLNRAVTLGGFSPQIVGVYEERKSNAQLSSYRRTRGELRAVRQF